MGQTLSSTKSRYLSIADDDDTRIDCDATRLFPNAKFLKCKPNDIVFSYKAKFRDAVTLSDGDELVFVTNTPEKADTLKKAATLSRFGNCHNFSRYSKSFVCNSSKIAKNLGCPHIKVPAYFTAVSKQKGAPLSYYISRMSKKELLSVVFQLLYTANELSFLDLGILPDLNKIILSPLNPSKTLVYCMKNGDLYSFSENYFVICTELVPGRTRITDILKEIDRKNRIPSFDREIEDTSAEDVFNSLDFSDFEGMHPSQLPNIFYVPEDTLPEQALGKYFAVSVFLNKNANEVANRLRAKWESKVDEYIDRMESTPYAFSQSDVQLLLTSVIQHGHSDQTRTIQRLNNIMANSNVSLGERVMHEGLKRFFKKLDYPDYEGETVLALEDAAFIFESISAALLLPHGGSRIQKMITLADDLFDYAVLEKLEKEIQEREISRELQNSKNIYVSEIHDRLEDVKLRSKSLDGLRRITSVVAPISSRYVYGSEEWKRVRNPARIEHYEDEDESEDIHPALSAFIAYLASIEPVLEASSRFQREFTTTSLKRFDGDVQQTLKVSLVRKFIHEYPGKEAKEIYSTNPATRFDDVFIEKPGTKPDVEKAELVAETIRDLHLYGPKSDEGAVIGSDADAEREFIAELNHAALAKLRGETTYDFEPCSLPFAEIGYCFAKDAKGRTYKTDKGIIRPLMPQLSGPIDISRKDTIGYQKAKLLAQKRKLAESKNVKPDSISDQEAELIDVSDQEIASTEVKFESDFTKILSKMGYEVIEEEVDPVDLKPIQTEMLGSKIAGMYADLIADASGDEKYKKMAKVIKDPIFTSGGYVIDGHHRWAALYAFDIANGRGREYKMKSRTIMKNGSPVPIEEMVDFSNAFQHAVGIINQDRSGKPLVKQFSDKELSLSKKMVKLMGY